MIDTDWDIPLGRTVPGALHGMTTPATVELQRELPWHRHAAYLIAGGLTPHEVAEAEQVSVSAVYHALRTTWFQERVTQIMHEQGGKDVIKMFKNACPAAFATLYELCTDDKVAHSVRRASAVDILDRAYGKPVAKVEDVTVAPSDDPVAEVAKLEAAVARDKSRMGLASPS